VRVALTFDTEFPGRPTVPGVEDQVLAALAAAGVGATFFLQGRWVRANPQQARRLAGGGHVIANHSNFHAPMDGLDDELFRHDVRKAEETILTTTGADPKPWFRCPFGAGMDDPRVLAAIEELGYQHVGWEHDPRDWDEGRTVDELVAGVGPGIVLLHAWPTVTAEGLGLVIAGLRDQGAEFVGVDELG
jgi:peptidoglycan/xylan/chitin deacetylase (PgdA/CDA1 family)